MLVPVMDVGEVGVAMTQRSVHVPVRMRLPWRLATIMAVLVVLIMHMPMLVGHLFVAMFVFVALCQMKPDSNGHEKSGDSELADELEGGAQFMFIVQPAEHEKRGCGRRQDSPRQHAARLSAQ